MKLPKTNSQWLADVQEAYESARNKFEHGLLEIDEIEDLYRLSAQFAAINRGINDPELVREMYRHSIEPVEYDFLLSPMERDKYKFQFVIAYIHSHVPAGIFTEMEGDRIIDYVNENWDLFGEA